VLLVKAIGTIGLTLLLLFVGKWSNSSLFLDDVLWGCCGTADELISSESLGSVDFVAETFCEFALCIDMVNAAPTAPLLEL